jgi:hypothetical protein
MVAQSRTLKLSILADVDQLKKSLKSAGTDVENSSSKLGEFSKKAGLAFAAAAAAASAFAVKIGIDAVKAASDLSETISKVGVLFGDTSKEIEKFAEGAAASLGQTKQQALDAAATFATFGKSAGLSGQELSNFSIDFVKLSSDLASFNNTSPEQAINAIGSALRGEAEPLRAYGVLLDDASLRQAALELGIINTTKNALTPQQKVLAAQALIYKQTGTAQGDFERTSDGLANKTRILSAQLENAKTVIGTALLPIVLQLATAFSDKIIPLVQKFTESFSNTQGNLGGVLITTGQILRNTFTPIVNGLVTAFGYVRKAIGQNLDEFKQFGGYIAKFLAPIIGTVLGGALQLVGKIAEGVINVIGSVLGVLNNLISGAVAGINALIGLYNSVPFLPNVSKISAPTIKVPTVSVPSVSATSQVPSISVPSVSSGTGSTVTGGGGGIAAAASGASMATANRAAINTQFFQPSAAANRAAGLQGAAMAGINVTVNGAIDAEGTARTIVKTLNDSYFRGTGGAGALAGLNL